MHLLRNRATCDESVTYLPRNRATRDESVTHLLQEEVHGVPRAVGVVYRVVVGLDAREIVRAGRIGGVGVRVVAVHSGAGGGGVGDFERVRHKRHVHRRNAHPEGQKGGGVGQVGGKVSLLDLPRAGQGQGQG
eukprot:9254680-Pyramimonas_sp.AAC.1